MRRLVRAEHFRFRPPPFEIPPSAWWALARAFGPVEPSLPELPVGCDSAEFLRWARALGLSVRIAHRLGKARLKAEIGDATAEELFADQRGSAARCMILRRLVRVLAEAAREVGTPVILLKGAALLESGVASEGSRSFGDVDALVPLGHAKPLASALKRRDFHPHMEEMIDTPHHLPGLVHPKLGLLELHVHLPGVFVPGVSVRGVSVPEASVPGPSARGASARGASVRQNAPATAEDVLDGRWAREARDIAGVFVPTRPLLVASAVAHGLIQHALAPGFYPPLLVVADLLDLSTSAISGPPEPSSSQEASIPQEACIPQGAWSPGASPIAAVLEEAKPLLAAAFSERELRALNALCAGLSGWTGTGESRLCPSLSGDSLVLLKHCLAGATDADYQLALKVRTFFSILRAGQLRRLIYKVGLALRRPRLPNESRQPLESPQCAESRESSKSSEWGEPAESRESPESSKSSESSKTPEFPPSPASTKSPESSFGLGKDSVSRGRRGSRLLPRGLRYALRLGRSWFRVSLRRRWPRRRP